jgi:hypothetical protein
VFSDVVTAPQLSIFQKALGTLPEDGNVMPKRVGATVQEAKSPVKKSRPAALRGGI